MTSWIGLGPPLPTLLPAAPHLMSQCWNPLLLESALEALGALITQPDTHQFPKHMLELLQLSMGITHILHEARTQSNLVS